MTVSFTTLLEHAGISPKSVKALRHVSDRADTYKVWLDDRSRLETYQSVQLKANVVRFRRPIWASFVGLRDGRTVFVGLYRRKEPISVPEGLVCTLSRHPPAPETHHWYDAEPLPELSEYSGRLVVEWSARRMWIQNGESPRAATIFDGPIIDQGPGSVIRNPSWTRDELILALDLYMTNPKSPPAKTSQAVRDLSDLLNALAKRTGIANGETFRNPAGVYMKTMNFRRFDPEVIASGKVGLTRGNKDEEIVWNLYRDRPEKLRAVAAAIRTLILRDEDISADLDEETYLAESSEGRLLTRLHRTRERDQRLVKDRKRKALNETGKLVCEVCDFDFAKRYGDLGEGFIEVHHTKPVHTLPEDGKTKLEDLALVCSNCHRMIHSTRELISIEELRGVLAGADSSGWGS